MYRSLLKAAAELRRAVLADDWSIVRAGQPICYNIYDLLEAEYGSAPDTPRLYSTLRVLFLGYPQHSGLKNWPVDIPADCNFWVGRARIKRLRLLDYLIEVLNAHPDNNQ